MKRKYVVFYDRLELKAKGYTSFQIKRMPISHFRGNQNIHVVAVCSSRAKTNKPMWLGGVALGAAFMNTGFVYMPYIPFITCSIDGMKPEFAERYASSSINPNYYKSESISL